MKRIWNMCPRLCFHGHTHFAGIFLQSDNQGRTDYHSAQALQNAYRVDDRKTLVNVGAVGQPRDGDWRASYALFDGKTIYFRRIEYDVDKTIRKIYANPEIENFLGDRLREGR